MNKTIILLILLIPVFVFGQTSSNVNPVLCQTIGECFDRIATVLLYIAITVVSLSIVVAGVIFLTGGTPARIELAKKIVLLAIGIFVIILLVKFIASITKGDLTTTPIS